MSSGGKAGDGERRDREGQEKQEQREQDFFF